MADSQGRGPPRRRQEGGGLGRPVTDLRVGRRRSEASCAQGRGMTSVAVIFADCQHLHGSNGVGESQLSDYPTDV
ncbi:MAG: hypothetical protein QOI02_565 [Actinomycetota bacterium]|nr:hypothetical protein [Actinomycetota bacterium]